MEISFFVSIFDPKNQFGSIEMVFEFFFKFLNEILVFNFDISYITTGIPFDFVIMFARFEMIDLLKIVVFRCHPKYGNEVVIWEI
ncbi:hypothetical protein D3C72_2224640 [compost metagenome]